MQLLFYSAIFLVVGRDIVEAFSVSYSTTFQSRRAVAEHVRVRFSSIKPLASSSSRQGGDFGELTSALATLDQQWQIQQSFGNTPVDRPKWSKLVLPKEDNDIDDDDRVGTANVIEDYVWMLKPPNDSLDPSCVVVFVGGAGLGQFPQVAYNELLSEISTKLNAVCLTVPYEVGLDHFSLAKITGEKLRRALLVIQGDNNNGRRLPTYSLAHSLGCKLQTIYMAATGISDSLDGVGFLAYNNFSFAKTISMARSFAQELRGGSNSGDANNNIPNIPNVNPEMINTFFDFAEMAVGAIGVEFSPTPSDTERLIQLRYTEELQAKTRVFRFGDDTLDSSVEFQAACDSFGTATINDEEVSGSNNNNNFKNKNQAAVGVSELEGGHLTPVFIKLDADELAKEAMGGFGDSVSAENVNAAKEAIGGFQGASFGDEPAFSALVNEVCDWVLGKPPAQRKLPELGSNGSSSSSA